MKIKSSVVAIILTAAIAMGLMMSTPFQELEAADTKPKFDLKSSTGVFCNKLWDQITQDRADGKDVSAKLELYDAGCSAYGDARPMINQVKPGFSADGGGVLDPGESPPRFPGGVVTAPEDGDTVQETVEQPTAPPTPPVDDDNGNGGQGGPNLGDNAAPDANEVQQGEDSQDSGPIN